MPRINRIRVKSIRGHQPLGQFLGRQHSVTPGLIWIAWIYALLTMQMTNPRICHFLELLLLAMTYSIVWRKWVQTDRVGSWLVFLEASPHVSAQSTSLFDV